MNDSGVYNLLYAIAQNTAGVPPAVGDGVYGLASKVAQNTAGAFPAVGDSLYNLFYKIAGNTAGISPQPGDRMYNLLGKIAANTGVNSPIVGDGLHNLLFKICENTEGGEGSPLDSDVAVQKARIEADGGTVTDIDFLSGLIGDLKAAGCYALLDALYVPIAVKKDGSDLVSKLYDLSLPKTGIYYDASQPDPSKQQLFQANQIDGKPWIVFDSAKGGYNSAAVVPYIDYPVTFFIVSRYTSVADNYRTLLGVSSAAVFLYSASYYNASIMVMISGGQINVNTGGLALGQFTFLFNGSASAARRKGVQITSGTSGALTPTANCTYDFGCSRTGSTNSGPIAFAAVCRQAITTQQRDAIENLLNAKYYPSTVA